MFITKKAISRRTVLRGMGAALALPLLDGMVPALTAQNRTAAKPIMRFGAVYVPMGMIMENWTPKTTGAAFEMTPIMAPLEPYRDQLTVLTGLDNAASGGHNGAPTAFLTSMRGANGAIMRAGTSMDQHVAQKIGQGNRLPSLELGLESAALVGDCENTACGYINTLAYSTPTTPLPVETDPRQVFERLFGDPEATTPEARIARLRANKSLLDSLLQDVSALNSQVGNADKNKINEYLDAVREVERRIQKAEVDSLSAPPIDIEAPMGAPAVYGDHAKLMFDLLALAFQSDLTRVSTMLMERELSSRRFPEIGLNDPHHSTTHNPDVSARLEMITMINTYQTSLFAHFVEKLAKTQDGDGSLLDHTVLVYGSGLSDGNIHYGYNLPITLVGKGAGALKGGTHLKYDALPMANMHLSLMDKFGVPMEKFGNSTGQLEGLSGI